MTEGVPQFEYPSRDLEAMSFAQNYHSWIADQFRPFLGRKVAEVGAGTGSFSELLLAMEIEELVAFEPAANQYPILAELLRTHPARTRAFNSFLKDAPREYGDHLGYHMNEGDLMLYDSGPLILFGKLSRQWEV